jgi:hypothetical protein
LLVAVVVVEMVTLDQDNFLWVAGEQVVLDMDIILLLVLVQELIL